MYLSRQAQSTLFIDIQFTLQTNYTQKICKVNIENKGLIELAT